MALARRSGQRFEANIWPGFVDAMTALLLVLVFVLSIFMMVQFMSWMNCQGRYRHWPTRWGWSARLARICRTNWPMRKRRRRNRRPWWRP